MEKDVTILMPCLNEEKTIKKCILDAKEFINKNNINGEIVVVDNGSIDKSIKIIKKQKVRLIKCSQKGYGNALRCGIINSNGKYIIMGDSDASYDFKDLSNFVKLLDDGYDLVMGNRFKGTIEKGAMPLLNRYIGNPFLSWFARKMFPCNIGDFHSGLRGFNKDKIIKLDLESEGMEFASEMVIDCVKNSYRICETPINLLNNGIDRKPHLRPLRDGLRHIKVIVQSKLKK